MLDTPLLTKPLFLFRQFSRQLWVRTSLISALALISAALGTGLGRLVPDAVAGRIHADAVASILEILASSMLAVTTFSVTVMVVARQWASNQSTPRANQVVQEDSVTQIALATFLGAFIFALASLILVEIGIYSENALTVVLGFTVAVILLVVIAMLRWIDHLSELGGVSETAGRIEELTRSALDRHLAQPCLGAQPCREEDIPQHGPSVTSPKTGYVRHVDASILETCAAEHGVRIWVAAPPGRFVAEGEPLARASGELPEGRVRRAFTIGESRSFDQDPNFGLLVLSEIAQRALSPGVNDPGTAISVVSRLIRLMLPLAAHRPRGDTPPYPHVHVPEVTAETTLRDVFGPIARDGADKVEVQIAVQEGVSRLARRGTAETRDAARALSADALARAESGLVLDAERARVRKAADALPK